MPLLDHFNTPLQHQRPWEGVCTLWASSIARQLNRNQLPERHVAMPHSYYGGRLEIDSMAVTPIPPPRLSVPVDFVDMMSLEVQVFNQEGGLSLVAVVELVSSANKDRAAHRQAFAVKCASYLQQGVSIVVVDAVTEHSANLHRELLTQLRLTEATKGLAFPDLYAVAYRTFTSDRKGQLQVWEEPLAVGRTLPTLPLWIAPDLVVPVDLESSYRETCEGLRIRL